METVCYTHPDADRHFPRRIVEEGFVQAVVLTDSGVRFDPSHDSPRPVPGEVPVRVVQAGICETDLQLMQGYMGFRGVLGARIRGHRRKRRLCRSPRRRRNQLLLSTMRGL